MSNSGKIKVRLRDALDAYDNELSEEIKAEFRTMRAADLWDTHFGLGMWLRNRLMWKYDIGLLLREIRLAEQDVQNGRRNINLAELERRADEAGIVTFPTDPDGASEALVRVLHLRECGAICIVTD